MNIVDIKYSSAIIVIIALIINGINKKLNNHLPHLKKYQKYHYYY